MIRNVPKRTISISSEFELLQMVSEPITERRASEDLWPQGRWIVRSHVGRENEAYLIRIWKTRVTLKNMIVITRNPYLLTVILDIVKIPHGWST